MCGENPINAAPRVDVIKSTPQAKTSFFAAALFSLFARLSQMREQRGTTTASMKTLIEALSVSKKPTWAC